MKIVIVGAGNTGTVLGNLIKQSGHEVVQIISRSSKSARTLAQQLECDFGILEDTFYKEAELYIICLADYAMNNIENLTALKGKFIVHTAGSLPIETLKPLSDNYGVLYPLQSLSKYIDRVPQIPFMVDGSNSPALEKITDFARSLSSMVTPASDKQRMSYHIAAVFAANFSNHMYALAEIYSQRESIDFKNLVPIINEINLRIKEFSPFLTQTGPAIRNDVFTITRHLNAMSHYEDLKYMYLKLTENILKMHGKR